MSQPKINDSVRLVQDIPEFSLSKGEIGVVRSTWFAPATSYEVEFHQLGLSYEVRCLLTAEQLVVQEENAEKAIPLAAQLNGEAGATAV